MGLYGATWEAAGYAGAGLVGELINSLQGRPAVVAGNAFGVFDEVDSALEKYPDAVVFGVNDVGMFLPKLDHWVSLHTDKLATWKNARWLVARDKENAKYHGVDPRAFIDYDWSSLRPLFALSGYFAMQIAHIMGSDLIVLCGCPGDGTRRFFESKPRSGFMYGDDSQVSGKGVRDQLRSEMNRLPGFRARVRSTSGWTQNFFGGLY